MYYDIDNDDTNDHENISNTDIDEFDLLKSNITDSDKPQPLSNKDAERVFNLFKEKVNGHDAKLMILCKQNMMGQVDKLLGFLLSKCNVPASDATGKTIKKSNPYLEPHTTHPKCSPKIRDHRARKKRFQNHGEHNFVAATSQKKNTGKCAFCHHAGHVIKNCDVKQNYTHHLRLTKQNYIMIFVDLAKKKN